MGLWKSAWLRVRIAASGHSPPMRDALELIRDQHLQNVGVQQIAANLNMLKIPAPKDDIWTEDSVKAALALLTSR